MDFKFCPIMTMSGSPVEEGCREDCAFYIFGRCAVSVIAEELQYTSASADNISDNLAEIDEAISEVANNVKGLM